MLLEKYLLFLQSEERSKDTQKSYLIALDKFQIWLLKTKNLKLDDSSVKNINRAIIREYLDELFKRGLKNSSRNIYIFALKSFFKWLHRDAGIIAENPIMDLQAIKIPYRQAESCSYKDIGAIFDTIDKRNYARNKAILAVMSIMGLRCIDLINLNRNSYFQEKDIFYLRIIGKGRFERIVALSPQCNEALIAYLTIRDKIKTDCPALFLSEKTKQRMGTHAIWVLVSKIKDASGVKVHPHKLRHTAGTMIYSETKDIVAVQDVLGHRSILTTKRYIHMPKENTRMAVYGNPLNNILGEG